MKRVMLILAMLAPFLALAEEQKVGSGQIVALASATGTPVQFTNGTTWVRGFTVMGKKAVRTDNVGTVYFGPTSANDTQPVPLASGEVAIFKAPPGTLFDLSTWYVDVTTANDGVVIIFQ